MPPFSRSRTAQWTFRATLLACLGWNATAGAAELDMAALEAAHATDQLVLKFRSGVAIDLQSPALRQVAQAHGVSLLSSRPHLRGQVVVKLDKRLPSQEATRLASALKAAEPALEAAQADAWATVAAAAIAPNDPLFTSQWHYTTKTGGGLNLTDKAWKKSKKGKGVVVAVLDTGYRPHVDLAANIVAGYDMIATTSVANDGDGRDADPSDPGDGCGGGSSWHGTHVAGTIAAVTNNGVGVAGVAPNAKVQPVRVLGCGGGYFSDIDAAIEWASGGTVPGVPGNPTPAKVINLSLGGFTACPVGTQTAISNAVARGTTVVVAAGNYNMDASGFAPANCAGVITVAAVAKSGGKASYSNFGATVEVAAPGGDYGAGNGVMSTLNAGYSTPGADSYAEYIGTSMATPHVSGVAALLLAKNPTWTPAQVLSHLQATARPFPATCNQCGSGIVDAHAAVR